jgi:5-methylcytosine-specific restriction endonuclease McrA
VTNGAPGYVDCVTCGNPIDLSEKSKRGYRKHRDVKICRQCRIGLRKHGMSVTQLAARYGKTCGICSEPVDMTLRAPDPGCASVDHIVPKAAGGTNDPTNLQLAHLLCNVRKGHSLAD